MTLERIHLSPRSRLLTCLVLGLAAVLSCSPGDETTVFRVTHPDLDGKAIDELITAIEAGRYGDVHSLIIIFDGERVAEAYFGGHTRDERVPLYSVTKSFLSALIGIAIADGHIASTDESVLGFFERNQTIANLDARKRRMTIGHLLSMTAGLRWDELSLPYDDPNNDYQKYLASDDRIGYTLDLPMAHEPGSQVAYNTALSQVLSAILTEATGMSAADYAQENLFNHLGITDWRWTAQDRRTSVGGAGLYLRASDLAKLGQLYLSGGVWDGVQVVPEEWVRQSTAAHGHVGQWQDYGYHWWRYSEAAAHSYLDGHDDIYYALGRGGQYLWVLPWANVVVSCTAWNDNNGYWPEPMLWDYVGPAIRR